MITTRLPRCLCSWIEGYFLEEGRRSFLVTMASLSPCQDSLLVSRSKEWAWKIKFAFEYWGGFEVEGGGKEKLRCVRLARQCGDIGALGGGKARLKDQVNLLSSQGGETAFETRAADSSTHFRVLWGRNSLCVWMIGGWLRQQRLIGYWLSCLVNVQGVWKIRSSWTWLESLLLRSLITSMQG